MFFFNGLPTLWLPTLKSTMRLLYGVNSSWPVPLLMKEFIEKKGNEAAFTPTTHNFDKKRMVSLWSHKHLGHLVGLGRYGTNCQLITPEGCSGRLGSLVTNLEMGGHPLVAADELCMIKAGKKCGKCIKSCPVEALSEEGMDRSLCYARLRENYHLLMGPQTVCRRPRPFAPNARWVCLAAPDHHCQ